MKAIVWACLFLSSAAHAAAPLPQAEAAAWLQKMADAPRQLSYEGVFVIRQGEVMQTYSVANRAVGDGNESLLTALDGDHREVRCSRTGAVTVMTEGGQVRMEKRLNRRHFPYLLPLNPQALLAWYDVRMGDSARVAGLECRNIAIEPRDAFRWGYALCVEKDSGLPLKVVVVDGEHKPLMQYAFAEVRLGSAPHLAGQRALPAMPEPAQPITTEQVTARHLPPGYTRIAAVKRHLPNMSGEVEQWVFSDGLTHISLFLTPAKKPMETVKGRSPHGLVNLMRRQVGGLHATVLGDAPSAAVETIALGLEAGNK